MLLLYLVVTQGRCICAKGADAGRGVGGAEPPPAYYGHHKAVSCLFPGQGVPGEGQVHTLSPHPPLALSPGSDLETPDAKRRRSSIILDWSS